MYRLYKFTFFLCLSLSAQSIRASDVADLDVENLKISEQKKRELNELVVAYSIEKKAPVVLTPNAVDNFLISNEKWKWVEINGIDIGYSSDEEKKQMTALINKNMDGYSAFKKEKNIKKIKIGSYRSPAWMMLKVFPEQCKVELKSSEKINNELTFYSDDPVSVDTACQVIIYAFSLSGINFKKDEKNNMLIAVQKKNNAALKEN